MTMYRVQPGKHRLQQFRSIEFAAHYQEKDLEDWLERNPEALTDGEPILVIGRQVSTSLGGKLDLLGLDANGAVVIVELKRAPTPRDVVAQALEYTAWAADLDEDQIEEVANDYLLAQTPPLSLEEAWQQAFGGGAGDEGGDGLALPADLRLNERQRTLVVIEGGNDRVAAVIRYLRSQGVDISLLEYRYYQTESGEEILDIEQRIGEEQVVAVSKPPLRYTEERLLDIWAEEGREAYAAFRDRLLEDEQVIVAPQKSAISFYKQTRDGRVFICYFNTSNRRGRAGFRLDSLQDRLDVDAALQAIREAVLPDVQINTGTIWCVLHFPASRERALEIAEIIVEHIASKVE